MELPRRPLYWELTSFLSNQARYFVIFTDSLSSINDLKSLDHKSRYLISKIHQKIQIIPDQKVVPEGVPSHVGIIGNEKADSLDITTHNLLEINHIQIPDKSLEPTMIGIGKIAGQLLDNTPRI